MKMPENTIGSTKIYFNDELNSVFDATEIESMFFVVVDHYFNLSKKDFILNPEKRLSESELLKVIYCVKALMKQQPLAYILGEWEFFGLSFEVNEHTLIPRPETEELVDMILKENSGAVSVLDIGTGSGCIPIALKKENTDYSIFAIDVSKKALDTAERNALLNAVDISFSLFDILKGKESKFEQELDVIVSNPPYIPESDKTEMASNVLDYEPHLALFVENNEPLLFYDAIAVFAKKNLSSKGKLYFEIHEKYGKEVKELLVQKGFKNTAILKDINGKDRIVKGELFN